MNDEPSQILDSLAAVRSKAQRRLLAYGVCAVLSGGCLSFLIVVALDWLLWLPPGLRIVGSALFVIGFGWAALHWIVRPWRTPLTLATIASRLERHFNHSDDHLSSVVGFLTKRRSSNDRDSARLVEQVVDQASRTCATTRFSEILTLRPLMRQVTLLVVGLVATGAIVAGSPQWFSIGIRRYVQPFQDVEWPRDTEIVPLTADVSVPIGGSATVQMRIVRGWRSDLRGVVHLIDANGRKTALAMDSDDDGTYRCTIEAVATNLTYWFEAGDDDTRRHQGLIEAVHRPAVAEASATLHAPDYAPNVEPILLDIKGGSMSAVPGSTIVLNIKSTKPVGIGPDGRPQAWLEFDDGAQVPLALVAGAPQILEGRLRVERDASFRVRLIGAEGFGNLGDREYHIVTRPDGAPTVVLLEPQTLTYATPRGSIAIAAQAEDDFGLSDVRLVGSVSESHGVIDVPLFDPPSSPLSKGGNRGVVTTWVSDRRIAVVRYDWNLEPFGYEPGTTVRCRIEATDNCVYGEVANQVGASPPFRVQIISAVQFETRLRDEFATLQRRLRQTLLEQQAVQVDTQRLAQPRQGDESGGEDGRDLGGRQDRLARQLIQLSRRFEDMVGRMQQNHLDDRLDAERVRRIGQALVETAYGPMQQAARLLVQASDSAGGEQQDAQLDEAAHHQEEAVQTLVELLRLMDDWGDYHAMVAKARNLFDRQQRLRNDTASLSKHTLGKRFDDLAADRRRAVEQLQRLQGQLGIELQHFLQRLRASDETRSRDRSNEGQQATRHLRQDALRAAAANEISGRMEAASAAIETNRLTAATIEQRAAEEGLLNMLKAFHQQRLRELAELAKRLERSEQAAARLLVRQRELVQATHEALAVDAKAQAFDRLAGAQRQVQTNTEELGKDLLESSETVAPGETLRLAATSMADAQAALSPKDDGEGLDPLSAQQQAVDLLEVAVELLEQRARQAAHSASQQAMAAMRLELQRVSDEQMEINDATATAIEFVASRGRLDRVTARRVANLVRKQDSLREKAEDILKELEKTVVYKRVLKEATVDMQGSRDALGARRLDQSLSTTQQRIVRRLTQLIRALADAGALPPADEFTESGDGGGGSGSQSPRRIIPPVAELLMLKTMQTDLLAETADLAINSDDLGRASEQQLAAIEALGGRQDEIRRLTEQVVQAAARRR